jgi:hypothetical protein
MCSSASTYNDASVCETGSYAYDVSTSGGGTSQSVFCQVGGDPTINTVYFTPLELTHDVSPIAAAMNSSGKAVIAYHKAAFTGSLTSPSCGFLGTFVTTYDPASGIGDFVQVDDGLGDTMHAQVAISDSGAMAVVWEEIVWDSTNTTNQKYVYLKTYQNGSWSTQTIMNDNMTNPDDSMMPRVGILDSGEIVVSFTYKASGATTPRRQYVKHLYYH